jgi:hypothetical protein
MDGFSKNTNLEIYYDLEKHIWFKEIFTHIESFRLQKL